VVPRPGRRLEPEDFLTFGGQRLARYKLPRSVVLVDALPRTAAGKIDKEQLKKVHGGP
jgi:fatty-acyl-CoA synthase